VISDLGFSKLSDRISNSNLEAISKLSLPANFEYFGENQGGSSISGCPEKFKIYDFSYFSRVLEFYNVRNIKIRKLPEKAIQRRVSPKDEVTVLFKGNYSNWPK
jgi:hypothetical protein